MKYNVDKQESYCIFKLEEENLNNLNAPRLKSELVFLSQEGVKNLILDISAVKFIDSSGLSSILTPSRIWKDNCSFLLCGPLQPYVSKLIHISKLDSILTILPSQSECIDYIKMEEVERALLEDNLEN